MNYMEFHRTNNMSKVLQGSMQSMPESNYLFTRNFSQPSFRKPTICLAAAIPALILASAVCAPIFFGVEK